MVGGCEIVDACAEHAHLPSERAVREERRRSRTAPESALVSSALREAYKGPWIFGRSHDTNGSKETDGFAFPAFSRCGGAVPAATGLQSAHARLASSGGRVASTSAGGVSLPARTST